MKITRLKVTRNDILGDLDLSFSNPDNTPIDTVIFAGENGSGKTTLMTLVASTLVLEINPIARPELHEVWITLEHDEMVVIQMHLAELNLNSNVERQIKLVKDFMWINNWQGVQVIVNEELQQNFSANHFLALGLFRTIYSDVAINFDGRDIQNTIELITC